LCVPYVRDSIAGMPEDTIIQPADQVSLEDLTRALNAAYVDYFVPIYLTPDSFRELVARETVQLEHSVVAVQGSRIVGMGLLGLRGRQAWIGGMGVLPDHRAKGIGRQLMSHLLSHARACRVEQVTLEVINENEIAYNLYQHMGFETVRDLHVLALQSVNRAGAGLPEGYCPSELPDDIIGTLKQLSTVTPPWQREETVIRYLESHLEGFGVIECTTGLIAGICLYTSYGDSGIDLLRLEASSAPLREGMLDNLLGQHHAAFVTFLNVPDDDPVLPLLYESGFRPTVIQHEMSKRLQLEVG